MGSMSAKQEAYASQECVKIRALLEREGYEIRKCQVFDAGMQVGIITWIKLEDVRDGQAEAEAAAQA